MLNIKEYIKKIPKPLISSIIYMIIVFFQSGVNLLTRSEERRVGKECM